MIFEGLSYKIIKNKLFSRWSSPLIVELSVLIVEMGELTIGARGANFVHNKLLSLISKLCQLTKFDEANRWPDVDER